MVPGVVGDTEEEPGPGDGVGTELGLVRVVDVASRSSSLISHQPPAAGKEVESEVPPSVLPVGGVIVVAGEGPKTRLSSRSVTKLSHSSYIPMA